MVHYATHYPEAVPLQKTAKEHCQGVGSAVLLGGPAKGPAHQPRYIIHVKINDGCVMLVAGEADKVLHLSLPNRWAYRLLQSNPEEDAAASH